MQILGNHLGHFFQGTMRIGKYHDTGDGRRRRRSTFLQIPQESTQSGEFLVRCGGHHVGMSQLGR